MKKRGICLLLALCGRPWGAIKAAGLFGVMLYIRTIVSAVKGASPAVSILLSALSTVFLFCFPMIVSFLLLIQTTRISRFLSASGNKADGEECDQQERRNPDDCLHDCLLFY